jgi:imidazolonepropionase-like amidohydrolase
MKKLICAGVFLFAAHPSGAQSFAITNAELHPVSGATIEHGTIVVENGIISAVGQNVSVPAGIRVIDGTGMIVTPGFIDSNSSQLGIAELERGDAGSSDQTTSEKDMGASFDLISAINPESPHIGIIRSAGITGAVVRPGGSNLFNGQGSLIVLGGSTVNDMIRSDPVAVYTALGETGSSRAGGSRAAAYRRIHDALWDARAAVLTGGTEDSTSTENKRPELKGGRSSLKAQDLGVLKSAISGEIPLVISANRVSDMRVALSLQSEFKIKMVIQGGVEAWRIADELAAAKVAVIVHATDNIPTFDGLAASLENAGNLQRAGVQVLFTGSQFGGARTLPHEAGVAVAYGMDYGAALRALTLGAAEVWGVADTMGSLEKGKMADLVVWSGDPLELSTSVELVFIGGKEMSEDNRQDQLFERYRNLDRYRQIRSR